MSWTATILLHCAGCRDPPTTVCKAHPTLLRCSWCSQLWHHGQGSSQHDAALCPRRSRCHRYVVTSPPPPLSLAMPHCTLLPCARATACAGRPDCDASHCCISARSCTLLPSGCRLHPCIRCLRCWWLLGCPGIVPSCEICVIHMRLHTLA